MGAALAVMAAILGCWTIICISGLRGSISDGPPEAAIDSCNFSSLGTVIGQGRGLSSCTATKESTPLPSGRLSKVLFFTAGLGVEGEVDRGVGTREGSCGFSISGGVTSIFSSFIPCNGDAVVLLEPGVWGRDCLLSGDLLVWLFSSPVALLLSSLADPLAVDDLCLFSGEGPALDFLDLEPTHMQTVW